MPPSSTPAELFTATVGVLFLENNPSKPWRSPVPPALAGARGWYVPAGGGPIILLVLPADALEAEALADVASQWQNMLESLWAGESVLLLTWNDGPPEWARTAVGQDGLWPIWLIDLTKHRVLRGENGDDASPLALEVDSILASYFSGQRMAPSDLQQMERGSLAGKEPFGIFLSRQKTPATWGLIGLLGAMFALLEQWGGSTSPDVLLRAGANVRALVEHGEMWRLLSANFLHIGWMHFLVNAYSLMAIGPILEKLFGTHKFLVIYLLSGVSGALASFYFGHGSISAGASTSLFGLMGAMLILGIRYQGAIPDHFKKVMRVSVYATLAINLAISFVPNLHIDQFAHLGGLLGGVLLAMALGPHPSLLGRSTPSKLQGSLLAVPLSAALVLGYSLWYAQSGQVPLLPVDSPAGDFYVRVPLLDLAYNQQSVFLSRDDHRHWVALASVRNHGADAPRPFTEENLEHFTDRNLLFFDTLLGGRYFGAQLRFSAPPTTLRRGRHRFILLHLSSGEEVYLTATRQRLYVVETKGLAQEPWMRPLLETALATFEHTPKEGKTP